MWSFSSTALFMERGTWSAFLHCWDFLQEEYCVLGCFSSRHRHHYCSQNLSRVLQHRTWVHNREREWGMGKQEKITFLLLSSFLREEKKWWYEKRGNRSPIFLGTFLSWAFLYEFVDLRGKVLFSGENKDKRRSQQSIWNMIIFGRAAEKNEWKFQLLP